MIGSDSYPILLIAGINPKLAKACLLSRNKRIEYLAYHLVKYCYAGTVFHSMSSPTLKFIFNSELLDRKDRPQLLSIASSIVVKRDERLKVRTKSKNFKTYIYEFYSYSDHESEIYCSVIS